MDLARARDIVRRHGCDTVAYQALEPDLSYWFDDDACVAYRDTGAAWIAAGGPHCAPERRDEVIAAFCAAAARAQRRVRFFAIESPGDALSSVLLGLQPEWIPADWSATVAQKRSLREQLRRARAKGITVRRIEADELEERRQALEKLVSDWQQTRRMAPMTFLVNLDPFGHSSDKRYFVAERDGDFLALLVAVPIPARSGWFFEDILRIPLAPNGTTELLFDAAMRWAAEQGCSIVSSGLAPLSGEVAPWLRVLRGRTRWLYDFEGLRAFKAKLQPAHWRPAYLSYPRGERGISALLDSLRAFAGGSLIGFGLRTIAHLARSWCRLLAALLVPWLVLLAIAPTGRWFPSFSAKLAWILFDVSLFFVLLQLARRWSPGLAVLAATATSLDAILGFWQLAAFNSGQSYTRLEELGVFVALVAPIFVAALLWLGVKLRPRLYLDAEHQ